MIIHRDSLSAAIAQHSMGLPDEKIFWHEGDKFNYDVSGEDVVIIGVEIKPDKIKSINFVANELVLIGDYQVFPDSDVQIVRGDEPLPLLVWEYFRPGVDYPLLLQAMYTGLYGHPGSLKEWDIARRLLPVGGKSTMTWLDMLFAGGFDELMTMAERLDTIMGSVTAESIPFHDLPAVNMSGYTVPCANLTMYVSECGYTLSKGVPFFIAYYDVGTVRMVNLYSSSGVDVGEIARMYGGNGRNDYGFFTTSIYQWVWTYV